MITRLVVAPRCHKLCLVLYNKTTFHNITAVYRSLIKHTPLSLVMTVYYTKYIQGRLIQWKSCYEPHSTQNEQTFNKTDQYLVSLDKQLPGSTVINWTNTSSNWQNPTSVSSELCRWGSKPFHMWRPAVWKNNHLDLWELLQVVVNYSQLWTVIKNSESIKHCQQLTATNAKTTEPKRI